jgi:hypothetical protein
VYQRFLTEEQIQDRLEQWNVELLICDPEKETNDKTMYSKNGRTKLS